MKKWQQMADSLLYWEFESKTIVKITRDLVGGEGRVLDVGCGHGRVLSQLSENDLNATGVDVNSEIVEENRRRGLNCVTVKKFERGDERFNAIIISHVIEHFAPRDLLPFLDSYLDRLEEGGHLIIATPHMTQYFFDDFDHVKPYTPAAVLMVFGEARRQVQYQSRNCLRLIRVVQQRASFKLNSAHSASTGGTWTKFIRLIELLLSLPYILSHGHVGIRASWIGIFRKTSSNRQIEPKCPMKE